MRRRVPTVVSCVPSITHVTDGELVEQARLGDTAAFGELVDRHQAAVVRTARIVCRSREDAEDVAQEALVTAWRKLDGFRGDAQFKTWLLAITWRHALTRRESLWRRLRRITSTDDERYQEPVVPGRDVADSLADRALVRALDGLVRRQPPRLRDPLLLAVMGDCTYEEMSVLLSVPSGTLKWRVMEARRRLKQQLAAAGYETVR
jgi:RNA polymerase sigma-70 factor (ECF subfamily)